MYDTQLSSVSERRERCSQMSDSPVNVAEQELVRFIDSVSDMVGPDQRRFLTEIWIDALASMECMPGPTSPDWRLVTSAASLRLAAQLLAAPSRYALV